MNQLTFVLDYENAKSYSYTYDTAGNLIAENISDVNSNGTAYNTVHKSYQYNDTNWGDKLTSYDGQTITYDAIGNPLSYRDGMTMTWKNGRQLATLQDSDDNISYTYDSESVRTSKTIDGVKHTYAYLGGKLMYETRGESKFYYSYDANGILYSVKYTLSDTSAMQTYFFTHNSRGDIVGIYDSNGTQQAKYEYDAWGNIFSITDANGNAITDQNHIANLNPFRYRGYYYDSETGLYYLMSRYYDPITHRFINADGYLQAGGDILDANMFAYCGNNPIERIDSSGTSWWGVALACFTVAAACAFAIVAAPVVAAAAVGVGITATVSSVTIASLAVGTTATCIGVYATHKAKSNSKSTTYPITRTITKTHETPKEETVIYRYRGTNPSNFVPSDRDVKTNSGLSFSTIPPAPGKKASITTIEALNATGVVRAYQDHPGHVRVDPVFGTLEDWRNGGSEHPCTIAVKSVVVKWDGGN